MHIKRQKILFLHATKGESSGDEVFCLPIGTIALADFLKKKGFEAEIIHLYVEKKAKPGFDIIEYAKKNNIRIFCLDLHWHLQSYSVISLATEIKSKINNAIVILGGFTASLFSEDILKEFGVVDFIIMGDSEIPLASLLESLGKQEAFPKIPNLVWRNGKKIIKNAHAYTVNQKIIDNLSFTNFDLISNYRYYLAMETLEDETFKPMLQFHYNCGRGCSVNCSYCGGSKIAQRIINNRPRPIFIRHGSVIRELKRLAFYGIELWQTSFYPAGSEKYYLKLFEQIRKSKIYLTVNFDVWALPTKDFIESFSSTFTSKSQLVLSPESGSEKIRRFNKGFYYSNIDLMQILDHLEYKKVNTLVCFAGGLPFEKIADIKKTATIIKYINNNFRFVRTKSRAADLDPFSPMFLNPRKFKIRLSRNSFLDFYNSHKYTEQVNIGYNTESFSQSQIIEINKLLDKK
ncbi:MAG: cobalamin-dependent protein [Candidatus Omnitrophota bacterium]